MTKEEIILKEITYKKQVVGDVGSEIFSGEPRISWYEETVVDPIKLAKFLVKFLKIDKKDLID